MAKYQPRQAPDHDFTGWPGGIPYIIGNEGCERFSFYGMRAILYFYIAGLSINLLHLDRADAKVDGTETFHLFVAGVYGLPLIGAIISDRLLGKYLTIVSLSVVYCAGHVCLALFEDPTWQLELLGEVWVDPLVGLYTGLALISVGSGGIKPCVSAHVGDQFGKGNWHLLPRVYNAFYFIINFGSAFSNIIIPEVRGELVEVPMFGYYYYERSVSWAFGIPGILMGIATIAFWMGRKKFIHVPPASPGLAGVLDVIAGSCLFVGLFGYPVFLFEAGTTPWWWLPSVAALGVAGFALAFSARQKVRRDDGFFAVLFCAMKHLGQERGFFGPARRELGDEAVDGVIVVLRILTVFLMVPFFWALFDQHASTWADQARQMDRTFEFSRGQWLLILGSAGGVSALAFLAGGRGWLWRGLAPAVVFAGALAGAYALGGTSFEIKAEQIQLLNPWIVMVLIPLAQFGLYPLMKRLGFDPTPLRRISLGMAVTTFSFVAIAILQEWVDAAENQGTKVHVMWQAVPYLFLTLGEVMVSITGLEFGYSQAPKRLKSVVMSMWLLMISFGNIVVKVLSGLTASLVPASAPFFWTFAGLMAVAAVLFALRAAFYQYKDHSQ
jgi:POT family proton-dependent oligopeptide transporter